MHKYQHTKVVWNCGILFQIYLLFIMEPILFENVGQILKCILYC